MKLKAHDIMAASVCFSPDGKRLASAGKDGAIRVWDRRPPAYDLAALTTHVTALEFRSDGRTLVVADRYGGILDLDPRTGEIHNRGAVNRSNGDLSPQPLKPKADDPSLHHHAEGVGPPATAPPPRVVDVHDKKGSPAPLPGSGTSINVSASFLRPSGDSDPDEFRFLTLGVRGLGVGPKGEWIVAGSATGIRRVDSKSIKLFEWPADAKPDWTPTRTGGSEFRGADLTSRGETTAVTTAPDGRWTAGGRADGAIGLWESATGTPLGVLRGHGGAVAALAASKDGEWLASAGFDGVVRVWDLKSRTSESFVGHSGEVLAVAFAPNGRWIASAGADHSIRIWDRTRVREPRVMTGHTAPVLAVAFSPDETRIVSGGLDLTARVWDATTGRMLVTLVDGEIGAVRAVAVAPDGDSLAVGGSRGLRILTRPSALDPLLAPLPAGRSLHGSLPSIQSIPRKKGE
jgi:WD40 repeat protein